MLSLKFRGVSPVPVEAECITPDNLRGKSPAEIAALPVQHGNTQVPLGEFFLVQGDASDGDIRIEGDCSRVKWLGSGMTSGRLTIFGPVGMHVGAEMRGGELRVHGQAGDWAGAEMRGGLLHIHGDAGHLAGAAYRGAAVGMRGGVLLIDGKAGNEIGSGMRRGLIAIGGDVGDFPGVSLVAGSLFVFGNPGVRPGANMKRGSLVFLGGKPALLPTFRLSCVYRPVFLQLYLRQLRSWGMPVRDSHLNATWERHCGDLVSLGKGEILIPA